MIENVSEFMGKGRPVAVGAVLAVAAIGMVVTVLMAGALGRESPQVAPIVIDSPIGGESSDDEIDGEEDGATVNDQDRVPSADSSAPGGGDSTSSGAGSVGSGLDSTRSGPVRTAPPPPPVTAAPPLAGGGDTVEPDEDDDPEDPDGSDRDDPGEDD